MSFGILETILCVFSAALVVSVVFRRLKLSVVLGYLLVGALVGPHAFGLVPDSEYVNNLAEFGIVFLMFTVGLEFSLPKLLALKKAVFGIGGLQVLLCVAVTTFIAMALGTPKLAALVVGSIVAMSSTALVIKQLNDQFELQTPQGLNAVGILLFQDLAVIPLIILIAGLAQGPNNVAEIMLWALGKGVIAILLIFFVGRWLLRPFLHFIAKSRSIELFTMTVLLVTLAAAWITGILGLSYALGAFLAGIMLAETEFRHQIEVEIRPFRDVLLALFFITIGMLTNVHIWHEAWASILLLLSALIFGKMILIALISRMVGDTNSTAIRTGIILAQGGEFGFAILTLALSYHVITVKYGQVILAALLLSIAIAPLLIYFNKKIAAFLLPKKPTYTNDETQQNVIHHAQQLKDHVIICGYGRVGQHIARLLDRVQMPYVGVDFDSELIQHASLAGEPVIYGDAAHPEILRTVGIKQAKVLVISLSDHRATIKILSMVRQRYPKLPVLVRCRDKTELKQIKAIGATHIIAEIFEASLTLSHHLMEILNLPAEKTAELIQEVRNSDYELLQKVFEGAISSEDGVEDLMSEHLVPIVIHDGAYGVGHSLADFNFKDIGVEVISIRRGDEKVLKPHADMKIQANDIVVLFGAQSNLEIAELKLLDGY